MLFKGIKAASAIFFFVLIHKVLSTSLKNLTPSLFGNAVFAK